MKMKAARTALLLAVVVSTRPLAAQSDTAEITGRILDASGVVAPALGVVVRNDDTDVKREIPAGDAGVYTVSIPSPCCTPGLASRSRQKARLTNGSSVRNRLPSQTQ